MTIRITSVPRPMAPNSGYHPMALAKQRGDEVWAIPNYGRYVGDYRKVRYFWLDTDLILKIMPGILLRALTLITIFYRALKKGDEIFLVHSFLYSLPLLLANRKYVIVIHGSDFKHLRSRLGGLLARRARGVFGVGFKSSGAGYEVTEIPNVFDISMLSSSEAITNSYDVLFILREAAVKNPSYPFKFYENMREKLDINVGVVGLSEFFLSSQDRSKLSVSQNHKSSIDYLGRCSFSKVASILHSSNILILPSHTEGVAKAMLEAMACGLHVIVSDKLILPEVFEEFVIKTDLYNWEKMQEIITSLAQRGRNVNNKAFAAWYLDDSMSKLINLYKIVTEVAER